MGLEEITKRLRNVSDKKVIHENDTIERFIVPIIRVAEWDVWGCIRFWTRSLGGVEGVFVRDFTRPYGTLWDVYSLL